MSYMIERGIIYLFCAILLMFLLMGCGTVAPPYVCQEAQHESGRTAILCQPIKPEQVIDVPARPMKQRPEKPSDGA